MISVDGSWGEGGGQILRTSLTLSVITGKSFEISRIRANRPKPGMSPQHLTAVKSAAEISQAQVEGAEIRSEKVKFIPNSCTAGTYNFSVPTAGAMCLVLQTVALPLAFSGNSEISLSGGTHVMMSPPYEYLSSIWGNFAATMGLKIKFSIEKAGYYPRGGGKFNASIPQIRGLKGINLIEKGDLQSVNLKCILSQLPKHIAEREISSVVNKITHKIPVSVETEIIDYDSIGPGNLLFLEAKFPEYKVGFSVAGERKKPAEKVAKQLAKDFLRYLEQPNPIEEHTADQILLLASLAQTPSCYRVAKISQHLLTNAHVIQLFGCANIEIDGQEGKPGEVRVHPAS